MKKRWTKEVDGVGFCLDEDGQLTVFSVPRSDDPTRTKITLEMVLDPKTTANFLALSESSNPDHSVQSILLYVGKRLAMLAAIESLAMVALTRPSDFSLETTVDLNEAVNGLMDRMAERLGMIQADDELGRFRRLMEECDL